MIGVTIDLDGENYCRYDPLCDTVLAHISWTDASNGDTIHVAINRLDGYGLFPAVNFTVSGLSGGGPHPGSTNIKLSLEDCIDLDGYNRAKSGYFTVHVTDGSTVWESAQFGTSVISVRDMRESWCKGLPLNTSETLEILEQPKAVTGVVVTEVQQETFRDRYALTYDHSAGTLAWADGDPVGVGATWNNLVTLYSRDAMDFIRVRVRQDELPSGDASDRLLVDRRRMTDAEILDWIWKAEAFITSKVWLPPYPMLGATAMFGPDYNSNLSADSPVPSGPIFVDRIHSPCPWETNINMQRFLNIMTPVSWVQKLYGLWGAFNDTKIVQITEDWQSVTLKNGMITLIPRAGAMLQWLFFGGFHFNILLASSIIPDFWQYGVMYGPKDLHTGSEAEPLREAIAKKAALEILVQAGLNWKPAYQAESLARDGVSSSVAYATGPGGIFSQTIGEYKEWLKEQVTGGRLRNVLVGMKAINL